MTTVNELSGSLKAIVERLEAEVRKDEQIGYPHDKPSLLLREAREALAQSVAALLSEARAEGARPFILATNIPSIFNDPEAPSASSQNKGEPK